VAQKN